MKKIATYTLGCKLNYSETSTLAEQFLKQGYELVSFGQKADLIVINTCSVTENANQKCRQAVRRALKKSPQSYIAVLGCYAQLEPEALASIDGVDLVLGAQEKFNLTHFIHPDLEKTGEAKICVSDIYTHDGFDAAHSITVQTGAELRTRAYLKIQDGCDYSCAFCTIPMARGASRSQSLAETVSQAETLQKAGYQEIVLTGVNVGDYETRAGENLLQLLQALEAVAIPRIRISSIEPNLLSSELIKFISQSNQILPHFHIPLQSGSDEMLRVMRRRYLSTLYRDRVLEIKSLMPEACIGADVIVGFPGESQLHFEETYQFLNRLPVSYLHVFSFSVRPNTFAEALIQKKINPAVSPSEKQARSRKLHELSASKKDAFARENLGKITQVLFEGDFSDEHATAEQPLCYGHTPNYLRVGCPVKSKKWATVNLVGKIVPVKLAALDAELNLLGECAMETKAKS